MSNVLSPGPKQQFFDNNGRPAVGFKLFTYEAGTTTKLATYVSENGAANANPIILDYRGECSLWIPPNVSYKYVLAPPSDTDPPTAAIWSVDDVVSSQLITLYGGVDTGSANAYVLNFTANFASLTDGIVIYWIPSNANTGASTLNVNGLGAVPVVNQNASTLTAGQLLANQVAVVLYKGGSFQLISSGLASSASQTVFAANRSTGAGDQTLTNNATTSIVFDSVTLNPGSNYSSIFGIFTAPFAGIYTFSATVLVQSNASAGQQTGVYFFSKNGGLTSEFRLDGIFEQQAIAGAVPANSRGVFQGVAIFQMNSGDTVQIKATQPNNGGGAFTLIAAQDRNVFCGYKCA